MTLRLLGKSSAEVVIIPGNHDYYTWNAVRTRRFEQHFSPWMQSDLPDLTADGTYPYVTSTSTVAGGATIGVGVGPTRIDAVWGINKAYATRVGAGPFPTRLEGDEAERLRTAGGEFGATTGRPRDCGWLDLPALKLAARLNGMTGLCVTKIDVFAALPEAKICRRYRDGVDPGRDGFGDAVPEYEVLEGWGDPAVKAQLEQARSLDALPAVARRYLDLVAEEVGVPITLVSVGADREQTIRLTPAF